MSPQVRPTKSAFQLISFGNTKTFFSKVYILHIQDTCAL